MSDLETEVSLSVLYSLMRISTRDVTQKTELMRASVRIGWDKRTDGNVSGYEVSTAISHFPSKFALDILGNL